MCHTDAELGVLSNQRLSLGEGGTDSSETDDDRSASPLMCTYLPIGELCHCGWFMLKIPPHALRLPSPPTPFVPPTPFPRPLRSALCTETKSGPVISPFHAVRFARRTLDLSLGGIRECHLFSFTQPSLSQRKITLYIYEWSCLLVYTELLF